MQFDEVDQGLTDIGIPLANGKKTRANQRAFYEAAVSSGLPLDSDLLVPYWGLVSQNKFGDKTKVALQNAIVASRKEGQPNGTPSVPVTTAPTSGGGAGPVAVGSVGTGGPVAAVNGDGSGVAGNPGAPATQVAPVVDTGLQPSTVVNTQQQGKTDPFQVSTLPSQTIELEDTSDDALEIARMTGNAGALEAMREDEEGLRVDAPDDNQAVLGEGAQKIVDARFGDSPTKERDVAIMRAYITALNAAPRGGKMKIQQEIGRKYGVGAERVRQLGNPQELIRVGESLGYDGESVLSMFDTKNSAPAEASESGKLKYQLKQLKKQYEAAETDEEKTTLADSMAKLSEQLDKTQQKEEEARAAAVATGLTGAGVEFDPEEGSGMGGLDEDRFWQKESSTGDNATNTIIRLSEQLDQTRAAIAEFEAQGNADVVAELEIQIANKTAQLQKLMDSLNEKPAEPKREVAGDLAAAKVKFKDVGRDVTKMEAEELKLLRGEAQRFNNKDLLAKIDAQLGTAPAPVVEAKVEPAPAPAVEPAPAPAPAAKPAKVAKAVTGEQVWADLQKSMPELVAYGDLSKVEQGYLDDLAERTNGKPVISKELGLQELVQRTKPAAVAETTDEQRAQAERHAAAYGGTVVWQEGDVALVRGYSMLSGQPVYMPTKGALRWGKDVESLNPPELADIKDKLVAAKNELEAADAEKHASNPFIKFDKDGLAVSSNVDPRLAGVVAGWKNLLNLKTNIYVTTIDDARADKDKFTGPHRVVGSAGLDANEAGSMRKMDGGYYIAFTKGTSYLKMLETIGHELGHVHEREAFANAPAELKKAIRAEHDKFIQSQAGKTGKQFVEALRARAVGRSTTGVDNIKAEELSSYWKSFGEWYADQVSKWATTSEKPVGVVEQFFAKLGAALKKFYYALKGQKYLPNETMKKFLDDIADRTIIIDPKTVSDDRSSQPILGGVRSFRSKPSEAVAETKAQLAVAKLMDSNGDSPEEIWADTGWYKNPVDGKWRFEIPDGNARFIETKQIEKDTEYELEEVLAHDSLFDVYPQLKEYKVVFDGDLPPGHGGFSADKKLITMSWNDAYNMPVLLHELQHAVQSIEGFALGGNPDMVLPYDIPSLKKLRGSIMDTGNVPYGIKPSTIMKLIAVLERYNTAANQAEQEGSNEKFDSAQKTMESQYEATLNADGVNLRHMEIALYQLIAGEQEAELVASRSKPGGTGFGPRPKAPINKVAAENQLVNNNDVYAAKTAPTEGIISKNIAKLPKQSQQPTRLLVNSMNRRIRKGLDAVVFTSDLVERSVKAGLSSAKSFRDLVVRQATRARELERDVERIADMYALVPERDRQGDRSVNMYLRESTRQGKWGYENSHKAKPDAGMVTWFSDLAPESQAFVKAVFDHGDAMLKVKKDTVMKFTASEYDAHIKGLNDLIASGSLNAKDLLEAKTELAEVTKEKKADLDKFGRLFALREGRPYAPIKRFGPYAVVAKSDEYMDAVKANDSKLLRKLEQDENHYHVTFAESASEAEALANRLEEESGFAQVQFFERSVTDDGVFNNQSMLAALTKLRSKIGSSDRSGTRQLQQMVSEMFLQELAENSARKTELRRRGVVGEVDMLRSFTTQGRADANFLASTQFGSQIQDTIQEMHKEARNARDRTRASEVLNEVNRRYQQTFDRTTNPWLDKLRRMSSVYFLATSPAYYIQNLTQPWMMSVPAMTGAHDYTKIHAELGKAYAQMKAVVKSGGLLNQMFDYAAVPGDVRSAIQELVNRGKIDVGMDTELGQFRVEGEGYFKDKINKIDKGMRLAIQKVEAINRLSTAMTAYRLERQAGRSHEQALEYADHILTETHGDYTGFNAPRAFNSQLGKVALQFRKFQLLQIGYYAKLINDIFTNPKDRKAAMKMLAYSLGHTAVLAGVRGLPGFATLAWVAGKAFGDDDEPYDLEQHMRNAIGDETMANLIMRGGPTLLGADISGKVGAGNMLSVTPFSDADLSTRAGMAEWVGTLLGGASLGMITREVDGMGQILSGNYLRGLELMLPKGLGDVIKGYRIGSEGMTRRNGDILMSPEDISFWDSTLQGLGISPVKLSVAYERQQNVKDMDQNFQDRTTKIKGQYIKAARDRDTAGMADARQAWTKMQEARARNGYTKQPMSNLLKAPQEQAKREKMTTGGAQYNKQNRKFAESQI